MHPAVAIHTNNASESLDLVAEFSLRCCKEFVISNDKCVESLAFLSLQEKVKKIYVLQDLRSLKEKILEAKGLNLPKISDTALEPEF